MIISLSSWFSRMSFPFGAVQSSTQCERLCMQMCEILTPAIHSQVSVLHRYQNKTKFYVMWKRQQTSTFTHFYVCRQIFPNLCITIHCSMFMHTLNKIHFSIVRWRHFRNKIWGCGTFNCYETLRYEKVLYFLWIPWQRMKSLEQRWVMTLFY